MSAQQVIPPDARDEFWRVVEACLRTFHRKPAAIARKLVGDLRGWVENPPGDSPRSDLFYHAEPFDVACDLADRRLDVRDVLGEYLRLRDG